MKVKKCNDCKKTLINLDSVDLLQLDLTKHMIVIIMNGLEIGLHYNSEISARVDHKDMVKYLESITEDRPVY